MKEHPIIFSAPMVRAILAGKKTQTRRIIKPQPSPEADVMRRRNLDENLWWPVRFENDTGYTAVDNTRDWKCPYGTVGGRLWVRESFIIESFSGGVAHIRYKSDNGQSIVTDLRKLPSRLGGVPSIHMPRYCSRILLDITDIRGERLHDISGADAAAEGFEPDWDAFDEATFEMDGWEEPEEFIEECEQEGDWVNFGRNLVYSREHGEWRRDRQDYATKLALRKTWEDINGPKSWTDNPMVWAVSFERRDT